MYFYLTKIRPFILFILTNLISSVVFAAPGQVYVNLFEWKYTDIEQECKQFLGPKGFSAVQISVPSEAKQDQRNWWERYQPASFRLDGRLGTLTELANMVVTCRNQGIAIYADVVLNHMANGKGTGEKGSSYDEAKSYPIAGFNAGDFHQRCRVDDSSALNVHDCWLDNDLPDLRTDRANVRQVLGSYLKNLLSLGIAGFRIDAAKHIPANDLAEILKIAGPVNFETEIAFGRKTPWVTQEVIGFGPIDEAERAIYFSLGTVNEFKYKDVIRDTFDRRNGNSIAGLFELLPINTSRPNPRGLFASYNATVFVSNHDLERRDQSMNNSYGKMFNLGNIFMLAYPYGQPQLQSGFKLNFANKPNDTPVPTAKIYNVLEVSDFTLWDQQHRWPEIANMVEFRNQTQSQWRVDNWTTDGADRIAFHRGDKGFIAINRNDSAGWTSTFFTGLEPGQYCNVINGLRTAAGDSCSGDTITVTQDKRARITVPSMSQAGIPAVAIHAGQRLINSSPVCFVQVNFQVSDNTTVFGQNVYLTGSGIELNEWKPELSFIMSASRWPLWTLTRQLKADSTYKYKYIKQGVRDLQWELGDDRTIKTPKCQDPTMTVPLTNFRQ